MRLQFALNVLELLMSGRVHGSTEPTINGVPEEYIIADSQYVMIIQVMTETFIRILRMFENNAVLLRYWLKRFIAPLLKIKFFLISSDRRYKHIEALIAFLNGAVLNKEKIDNANLLFVEKSSVDKTLLEVFYSYIKFCIAEEEDALIAACS